MLCVVECELPSSSLLEQVLYAVCCRVRAAVVAAVTVALCCVL